MFKQIDRYIARLTIVPILATLTVAILLLLLQNMYRLFQITLVQGQPVGVVWRMLGTLVPEYLALGIPLSLLLGTMLAFRRLALSNELDALQTSGCGYLRLMKVPLLLAVPLAILTFVTVGYIQPVAEYALQNLLFEVRTGQFGLSIKQGEFVHVSDNVVLQVRGIKAGDEQLNGIFARIANKNKPGQTVITAASGKFLRTDDPNVLVLRLNSGEAVQRHSITEGPSVLTFNQYDVPIHLPEITGFRGRGSRNSELTLPELSRAARDTSLDPDARELAAGEFNRRLVLVFLPFVIPFLAVASAVPPKRSSSPLGMILGFASLIVLFKVLDFGAAATSLPVVPLLWTAFAAFTALSLTLFYGLSSAAGTQYLGLAYRWADRILDAGTNIKTGRRRWNWRHLFERLYPTTGAREAHHDAR